MAKASKDSKSDSKFSVKRIIPDPDKLLKMTSQFKIPKPKYKSNDLVRKIGEADVYKIVKKIAGLPIKYRLQNIETEEIVRIDEIQLELIEKAPE